MSETSTPSSAAEQYGCTDYLDAYHEGSWPLSIGIRDLGGESGSSVADGSDWVNDSRGRSFRKGSKIKEVILAHPRTLAVLTAGTFAFVVCRFGGY